MRPIKIINAKLTERTSPSFQRYLSEIQEIPLLSLEEEKSLTIKAAKGDSLAQDQLVRHNLRFVVSVAKLYDNIDSPLEDLVNEGNIGLIQAAQKFNPDKEVRFISYAVWYIRARISEYINNHSRLIRLPSNRLRQISKMNATLSEIEKGTSEVSSSEPDPDIYDYLKTLESTRIQSLDLSYGEEESLALIDTIQDSMFPDADELMDKDVLANKLEAILDTLPRQYKEVLIRLYGINRDERMTLDQIGKELGVSRQRIQQVSQRALKQLRANLPITLLEELNL